MSAGCACSALQGLTPDFSCGFDVAAEAATHKADLDSGGDFWVSAFFKGLLRIGESQSCDRAFRRLRGDMIPACLTETVFGLEHPPSPPRAGRAASTLPDCLNANT